VSASIAPPPEAQRSRIESTYPAGWTSSNTSRETSGASTRDTPNQSCALISDSSARIRAGRSG